MQQKRLDGIHGDLKIGIPYLYDNTWAYIKVSEYSGVWERLLTGEITIDNTLNPNVFGSWVDWFESTDTWKELANQALNSIGHANEVILADKACTCDFYTVVLPIGCQCGGK